MPRPALGDVTSRVANEPMNIAHGAFIDSHEAAVAYFAARDKLLASEKKATGKKPSAAGSKRKVQESATLADPDDFDVEGLPMDKTCNQIRGMIRRFLDSGEMKKGEFCNAIGVSPNSLNTFLGQNGSMAGSGSNTYSYAWEFFKKRELAGIKASKKAKTAGSTSAAAAVAEPAADINSISLPGEEDGNVRIFETCDEIRKKIDAHLKKPGVTQAAFCRDLAAQLAPGTKIQSKQLTDFRSKKGARQGNTSSVFYAAYVYFEKLRIAENKPKTKHRKEMEEVWAPMGGFDTVHGGHLPVLCRANSRPYEDSLGRIFSR